MAELPEVRAMTEVIAPKLELYTIRSAVVNNAAILSNGNTMEFKEAVINRTITSVNSFGKTLVVNFSDGSKMRVKFALTGELDITSEIPTGVDVMLGLCNGTYVSIVDHRHFAKIIIEPPFHGIEEMELPDIAQKVVTSVVSSCPDAMSDAVTPEYVFKMVNRSSVSIKTLLCDQSIIAGIGNTYADEILFRAAINPTRRANTLSIRDCEELTKAIHSVLSEFIRVSREYAKEDFRLSKIEKYAHKFTEVHGRSDCHVCGSRIKYIRLAGKGTYFCEKCQGVIYASYL